MNEKVPVELAGQAPHLARPLANMPPIPMGGVWRYYTEFVSKDL